MVRLDLAGLADASREALMAEWREVVGRSPKGAVRLTSPSISIRMTAIFYGVTKERHSVRAASRLSLNVLRFESDLCELNRL